jgi:hypothetical protein
MDMADTIKVYRTDKSFPNSILPEDVVAFGADLKELHMINSRKKDPSLVFVALNKGNVQDMQVVIEIPFSKLNEALAELGYTLFQP